MDCKRVDEELVPFALAALDGATRAALEAHLVGCSRCVSAYLAVKRAVDAGEEAEAPSELARARVRAEAERTLAAARPAPAGAAQRPRRAVWAVAAAAAATMLLAPLVWRAAHEAGEPSAAAPSVEAPAQPVVPTRGAVDTARAMPENLSFL